MAAWTSDLGAVSATSWERMPLARQQSAAAPASDESHADEHDWDLEPKPEPCPVEPFGFECPMGLWWHFIRQEEYLPLLALWDWLPHLQDEIAVKREPVAIFQAWTEHEKIVEKLRDANGDVQETRQIMAAIFAAVEEIRSWH